MDGSRRWMWFVGLGLIACLGCLGDDEGVGGEGPDLDNGRMLFESTCGNGSCHGPTGMGAEGPNLMLAVPRQDDQELENIIRYGVPGVGMGPGMPPQDFDDDELTDLIAFLRNSFAG